MAYTIASLSTMHGDDLLALQNNAPTCTKQLSHNPTYKSVDVIWCCIQNKLSGQASYQYESQGFVILIIRSFQDSRGVRTFTKVQNRCVSII